MPLPMSSVPSLHDSPTAWSNDDASVEPGSSRVIYGFPRKGEMNSFWSHMQCMPADIQQASLQQCVFWDLALNGTQQEIQAMDRGNQRLDRKTKVERFPPACLQAECASCVVHSISSSFRQPTQCGHTTVAYSLN